LTFRQLFDAFLYGASLLHKIPKENDATRRRFLEVYDKEPRATLLYALNTSRQSALHHVGNVAVVIHQDFVHWQHTPALPRPDVRWHDRLFDIAQDQDLDPLGHGDDPCSTLALATVHRFTTVRSSSSNRRKKLPARCRSRNMTECRQRIAQTIT
jgi:hypothetical protein